MTDKCIWQGQDWMINANMTYSIPGYVYVTHRDVSVQKFGQLSNDAAAEMGHCLKYATNAVETVLQPQNILVGRFGLVKGSQIHFHIAPVFDWVIEALQSNPNYTAYQKNNPENYPAVPDGAELQAFIWREMHMRKTKFLDFDAVAIADRLEKHIAKHNR